MELRDQAITVLECFTAMRSAEVHTLQMAGISNDAATSTLPRSLKLVVDHTKTDPTGQGPVSDRTYHVPCTCLVNMEKAEKAAFVRSLKKDPLCQCVEACPFGVLTSYLAACPKASPTSNISLWPELHFARALTAHGHPRTLTCGNLGINEIYKAPERVNQRLPEVLRLTHATGHTGRNTFATLAMNNGADQVTTAAATKHKNPKTLLGYARGDKGLLMGAAMHVAQALPSNKRKEQLAGVFVDGEVAASKVPTHTEDQHERSGSGSSSSSKTDTRHTSRAPTALPAVPPRFMPSFSSSQGARPFVGHGVLDSDSSTANSSQDQENEPPQVDQPHKKQKIEKGNKVINMNFYM